MPSLAKSVDDPAFGKLVYDGNHHGGWATSIADPRFVSWGAVVDRFYAPLETGEPAAPSQAEDFARDLLAVAQTHAAEINPSFAEQMLKSAREFDAYDGSLDAEPLRKAGRLKVVVDNLRDQPPTPEQQAAWRSFLEGGDALAERIAQRLLKIYQQHRPEVLRWWQKIYTDSPGVRLPEISDTREMRAIVRVKEIRVRAAEDCLPATVGLVLQTLWSDRDIDLRVADGRIVLVGPEHPSGVVRRRLAKQRDIPPFGMLKWAPHEGWHGVFHSNELRGFHTASEERYRFIHEPRPTDAFFRQLPPWEVVTGVFDLQVDDAEDEGPTEAQATAYRKFTANPQQTAFLILAAILVYYQNVRPSWLEESQLDEAEALAIMPDIQLPEGLLDIIQLDGIKIHRQTDDRPPAIGIYFHWFDEHGLGVRWRDGRIEDVGDFETADDPD